MKPHYIWPITEAETQFNSEEADVLFKLFLGRTPKSENERNIVLFIGRHYPNPRLELIRHFLNLRETHETLRDFCPIVMDKFLRDRNFGNIHPPRTNIFCIGAARCGTTSLSVLLGSHPEVFVPEVKETNFFSHHLKTENSPQNCGIDWYEVYYTGYRGERFICDLSPNYIHNDTAKAAILQYNQNATIIVCLRDPVERALSDFSYLKEFHKYSDPVRYFSEGIERYGAKEAKWYSAEIVLRKSMYAADLEYWTRSFPRNIIITFEELSDMGKLSKRLFSDLKLDDLPLNPRLTKKINQSERVETEETKHAREMLAHFYHDEIQRLRDMSIIF